MFDTFAYNLEFEYACVLSIVLLCVIILFDIFAVAKITYILAHRSLKNSPHKNYSPKNNGKEYLRINTEDTKESIKEQAIHVFKKCISTGKKVFIWLFSLQKFHERFSKDITFTIWKINIRIPFKIIWGLQCLLINGVIILLLYALIQRNFFSYPQMISTYPQAGENWNNYQQPIEILFDIPVDKNSLILNMSPETPGEWKFEQSLPLLPYSRKVTFYPDETIFPGEHVLVYLTDLTNHYHTMDGGEHPFEFDAIALPQIRLSNPENNATEVPIDTSIKLELTHNDGVYVDWDVECNKDVEYEVIRDNSSAIWINFKNNLNQDQTYTLDVFQTPLSFDLVNDEITNMGKKEKVYTLSFETISAPLISSITPEGTGILPNEKIVVAFDDPMDKQSVETAFSIQPEVEGIISWDDDKTFVFSPKQLEKGTHYELAFTPGITSTYGGFTEKEIKHAFDTIGNVTVVGWSPVYSGVGIPINSVIRVSFDQAVNHTSAQNKFSINPQVSGSFSWNGNSMIFTPDTNLAYNTKYHITIFSGIKTMYGLDSNINFSSHFTTETQTFILDVPQYHQTHSKTCNLVAAQMVLAYKGVQKSEMQIYNEIAKDTTSCNASANTWGNPHIGYVGTLDGSSDISSCDNGTRGYGVYWEPVSSLLSANGVSNQIYRGWNITGLAKEIEKGHPVIIWWQNGYASPTNISWTTPGGAAIYAISGMHSEVAVGFIGSADNPTHIITNDPWRGRRTLTVGYFDMMWANYFGRTGIAIY